MNAITYLEQSLHAIDDRAAERDTDSERSMATAVEAFNAMYGKDLTETEGWMFMVFLKASRAKQGDFRDDDYIDGASYFALAGEAHCTESTNPSPYNEGFGTASIPTGTIHYVDNPGNWDPRQTYTQKPAEQEELNLIWKDQSDSDKKAWGEAILRSVKDD